MYVADDQPADLYDMPNMIQKTVGARNIFDMQPIMEVSGPLPYDLKTGVERTIEWLREKGKI